MAGIMYYDIIVVKPSVSSLPGFITLLMQHSVVYRFDDETMELMRQLASNIRVVNINMLHHYYWPAIGSQSLRHSIDKRNNHPSTLPYDITDLRTIYLTAAHSVIGSIQ